MRSSILAGTAIFAALALGSPINKRVYVTEDVIVTVTTTVTDYGVDAPTPIVQVAHSFTKPSFTPVSSSTVAPAPVSTSTSTSIYVAPTPSTTSTYVAPAPSTTSVYVAPTPSTTEVASTSSSVEVVAVASSTTAAAAAASSASTLTDYASKVLYQHNIHRSNHSASNLAWSDTLAATALKIAQTCVYEHNTDMDGGGYGQNIGAGASPDDVPAMITNEMYNGEIGYYPTPYGDDSPDMTYFENWGHFSQIVWSSTTVVGCATYQCSTLANTGTGVSPYFTVCNYSPPGNYAGEYSKVGAPLGDATVTV